MGLVKKVIDGKLVEIEENEPQDSESQDGEPQDGSQDENDELQDGEPQDDELQDGEPQDELWMSDEDSQTSESVPVSTHIKMKRKLKGRLSDQEEELQRLREENATLKAGVTIKTNASLEKPKRPKESEFDTIQEYEDALEKYEDDLTQYRVNLSNQQREIQKRSETVKRVLEEAVDSHYERAAKLIESNKINPDVYQQADHAVRKAIDSVKKGMGDIIADQMISVLGNGSEKVFFYLGRNKKVLESFKNLFVEDPSGLKVSIFLGQQKERLLNSKQRTSNARPPASDIKGDNNVPANKGGALLKKRQAALKKGNIQEAYELKKQAREQGIDVSEW